MDRIYIPEHKRLLDGLGYEFAKTHQRFDNAFTWYQSRPMEQHIVTMEESALRLTQLVSKVRAYHTDFIEDGTIASLHDPEPPEKDKGV